MVLFQKSNCAPEVSTRTNLVFGNGGVTRPPRYVWLPPCCAGAKDARIKNNPKKQYFTWGTQSVNDDRPMHAEVVMNGTDVVESARRCEGHPKSRYTRRRLGEV